MPAEIQGLSGVNELPASEISSICQCAIAVQQTSTTSAEFPFTTVWHGNHSSTCSGQDLVWFLQHSVNRISTGKRAKTNAIYPGLGKDHSRGHVGVSGGMRLR